MKSNTIKYIIITGTAVFFAACSTKKNSFLNRNAHAVTTEYNILYNGGIALEKGIADLKSQYKDNFWETLPIERMQITQDQLLPGQTKNANFERAEDKATKAIQKHSMNIDGGEKNPQIDEAHLMLGKARYYEQRFVPALEAFNYVLYKYPNSDKIYEVKIWREKTNMRMDNDALAVNNLRKLLKEIKFKNQIFADANATLAQAFLNLKENDSAIAKLKLATEFTKSNEEKSRYRFILGQVYEKMGHKDSAFVKYQEVIDMNRKAARHYVIQSHARQAQQFDFEKGDTLSFLKKYSNLLKDRENRPFLDVLNHQMALFYDKLKKHEIAKKYYNKSLKSKSTDEYLIASNYRNLAEIFFNKAKYETAGKYYDSTLTVLNSKTREYKLISKKRENLVDVIKFEGIAQRNDSIINVASMSASEKENYYNLFIENLKKEEKQRQQLAAKEAKIKELALLNSSNTEVITKNGINELSKSDKMTPNQVQPKAITPTQTNTSVTSNFYFYNPSTVAFGKVEFKKKWGNRPHVENWRWSKDLIKDNNSNDSNDISQNDNTNENVDERYTTDFYIKKLPTNKKDLDSIALERNFAYYQLGVIYKEKFKEYNRAAKKLEQLLLNKPEERLVLPSMYNLYKIYEITNPSKALAMKAQISNQYPDSRYAQIINNVNNSGQKSSTPEVVYDLLYKDYEKGMYREILPKVEQAIEEYTGEEMVSKFELLKANLHGRLIGLSEYKKALNYVALTYPNSEEGKATEVFISKKIPYLESLSFNTEQPTSWNILYKADNLEDKNTKTLLEKLDKFAKERTIEKLTTSTDIYTLNKNFIVIHGIKMLENAKGIAQVLKEFKEYKITEPAIIISSENYKVVQIKKNIDDYLATDWLSKDIVPIQRVIEIEQPKEAIKTQASFSKNDVLNKLNQPAPEKNKSNQNPTGINSIQTDDAPPGGMMPPTNSLPKK